MASCENPIGKVTAARQKNITATKPTHFAYGVTVLSQSVAISKTIVVVTQIHPQNTQTRVISHEGLRVGVKQVEGRLCNVRQVCISPSLVSPPTSVTIQSGMARAATAKISAARKSAPEIKLSLSIF